MGDDMQMLKRIFYVVAGLFLVFFSIGTFPFSLLWVIPGIWYGWRWYQTRDEHEVLNYAKEQAKEEGRHIRLQAKLDTITENEMRKARQDAGLEKSRKSILEIIITYPFHFVLNILRNLLLQPWKPYEWYRYKR